VVCVRNSWADCGRSKNSRSWKLKGWGSYAAEATAATRKSSLEAMGIMVQGGVALKWRMRKNGTLREAGRRGQCGNKGGG